MFQFNRWLKNRLVEIKADLGLNDYEIEVFNEQNFAKPDLTWNKISVVVKKLNNLIQFQGTAVTQPIQLYIMAEENSLEAAQILFSKFSQTYNWFSENITENSITYNYRHQYQEPVVLNNFNIVGVGYRSILFVTCNLLIIKNVSSVTSLTIDGESIIPLSTSISYGMSGNTQQLANEYLSKTVKSSSSISIFVTLLLLNTALTTKVLQIMNGVTGTGNEDFVFSFNVGSTAFSYNMKLTSAKVSDAPNEIPSLQLGFTR